MLSGEGHSANQVAGHKQGLDHTVSATRQTAAFKRIRYTQEATLSIIPTRGLFRKSLRSAAGRRHSAERERAHTVCAEREVYMYV